MSEASVKQRGKRVPQNHRTIDRVTRIIEEVVYNPGMTFAQIARVSGAAKSSAYGFVNGLLARGWLYEDDNRYYLGPAVHGLTLASGHIRAGLVGPADLAALHEETGNAIFLGVRAADDLIYILEAGGDDLGGFDARTNIRRTLLGTVGGRILLAALPDAELEAYLKRQRSDHTELVDQFLQEVDQIRATGFTSNEARGGMRRAIATWVDNRAGQTVASITMVGRAPQFDPRMDELKQIMTRHRDSWSARNLVAREVI